MLQSKLAIIAWPIREYYAASTLARATREQQKYPCFLEHFSLVAICMLCYLGNSRRKIKRQRNQVKIKSSR